MATFILDDATGIGSNDLDAMGAFIDISIIANDNGVGLNDPVGGMQQVTYARSLNGPPQLRLDALVNTSFDPDYGGGAQHVDVVVIAGLSGFTLDDGTSFANNGTALPPMGSGLPGAGLNTTANCLVIYDTQQTICVARDGSGGDIDLPISNPVVLYHEFSHAFRILNNALLALTAECDPSSPEERAAITDENDLRTQIANNQGVTPELRDPGIHCGRVDQDCSSCCIIATVVSKSLSSPQVQSLRNVRDHFVRSTEVGYAFFEQFFRDYYAFSPQVCTIMAGSPGVKEHLLEGYINPLLDFWKLMISRSQQLMDDEALGAAFIALHPDVGQAKTRLDELHNTVKYWLYQEPSQNQVPTELIDLLKKRAWPSEYIQWALVKPVRIYHGLLKHFLAGADPVVLGSEINCALASWVPEMPISDVWAALGSGQVSNELNFCDRVLLQTASNRKRYHERLKQRFQDITAINAVLDALPENAVCGGGL